MTRNDGSVKVDRAIISQARAIAHFYGLTVAEVISETVREPMARYYVRMLREVEECEASRRGITL